MINSEFSAETTLHRKLQKDFEQLQNDMTKVVEDHKASTEELIQKHQSSMNELQQEANRVPILLNEVDELKHQLEQEKLKV